MALAGCSENLPQPMIPPEPKSKKTTSALLTQRAPQPLDLTSFYTQKYDAPALDKPTSDGITGKRIFDGLPFWVNGRAVLYGKQQADDSEKNRDDYPEIIGVKVGRTFDELHLLHTTQWPDIEGTTIARVRLNYTDGTKREMDIGYGVHTRDWQRLQTEEREAVTDPQTKVVWRGPGKENFKSSQRMFKSVLMNPLKAKRVDTIDFVSAGQIASYGLYAATVTDSDPKRKVTSAVPLDRPEWNFDGQVRVKILDLQGNPIKRAVIDTSLSVPDTGWATSGAPHHSSAEGTAIVKYPKARTDLIIVKVSKEGWQTDSQRVHPRGDEAPANGVEIIFRLSPSP
jgi:hypothetical protein